MTSSWRHSVSAPAAAIVVLFSAAAAAQQPQPPVSPGSDVAHADLAKQLSNPLAALVSVPFQFNWEEKVGPSELTRFVLNVQPVMPFTLNERWNLIARVIAPFIGQPPLVAGGSPTSGLSDLTTSFFFAPSNSTHLAWGAGPVFVLPSTSEPTIGSGKWSAGPTIVALKQDGPWTIGALWNQFWSFAGDATRPDVNQMFLQPFVAYQATKTLTVTVQSESTANWDAEEDGDRWTVPVNVLVGKLATFGTFPASYQFGAGVFVAHPTGGPSWKIRAAIVILLPRARG